MPSSRIRTALRLTLAGTLAFTPLMLAACDRTVQLSQTTTTKPTEMPEGTKKTTETTKKTVETEKK